MQINSEVKGSAKQVSIHLLWVEFRVFLSGCFCLLLTAAKIPKAKPLVVICCFTKAITKALSMGSACLAEERETRLFFSACDAEKRLKQAVFGWHRREQWCFFVSASAASLFFFISFSVFSELFYLR